MESAKLRGQRGLEDHAVHESTSILSADSGSYRGRIRTRDLLSSTTTRAPEAKAAWCCLIVAMTMGARWLGNTFWVRIWSTLGPLALVSARTVPKSRSWVKTA